MGKSKQDKVSKQILEDSSIEYVKDIYNDLMQTYQVLFEHMNRVDQLIKEQKSKK